MRPYLAILSARFRVLLQYRAAAWAGVATQLFWGLIRVMIFTGFYHSTTQAAPMDLEQVVAYIWLGQALLGMVLWGADGDVAQMMRTGTVAYELARPLDVYALWFSRSLAARVAVVLPRAVPIFILSGLLFGLGLPPTWQSGLAFVCALAAAFVLAAAISVLATITLMWTVASEGIGPLLWVLGALGSGLLVPLPLFPELAQRVLYLLPFRGLMDTPARLYTGHLRPEEAVPLIAGQLAWTAAYVVLGRWLVARGAKRVVVQGG